MFKLGNVILLIDKRALGLVDNAKRDTIVFVGGFERTLEHCW